MHLEQAVIWTLKEVDIRTCSYAVKCHQISWSLLLELVELGPKADEGREEEPPNLLRALRRGLNAARLEF